MNTPSNKSECSFKKKGSLENRLPRSDPPRRIQPRRLHPLRRRLRLRPPPHRPPRHRAVSRRCHPMTSPLPFPFSFLPRRGYNSCNVPAGQFGHPSITLWNLQPPWDDSAANERENRRDISRYVVPSNAADFPFRPNLFLSHGWDSAPSTFPLSTIHTLGSQVCTHRLHRCELPR